MLSLVIKKLARSTSQPLARAACLAALSMLIGCSGNVIQANTPIATNVAKQSIDEPKQRSRAMRVFFYQSRVGDAVMNKYPFLDAGDGHPRLAAAEARMMSACSHLAQAALHKVSGGEPGVRLKFMVFLTLDTCEKAAKQVETLLSSETILAGNSL
ncbi:MAG: hypothetical protein ACU84Q_06415 [Gammaproteobacteria bacterium]